MFVPTRAAFGALFGLVLLAGCSSASTAPTTSAPAASAPAASASATSGSEQVAACTALSAAMSDTAATMQSALSEISTDPDKAITALEDFRNTFAKAVEQVNDPTVKAQAEKSLAATKKMVTALKTVIKDPTKASEMQGAITDFQTEMTNMGKVCP